MQWKQGKKDNSQASFTEDLNKRGIFKRTNIPS